MAKQPRTPKAVSKNAAAKATAPAAHAAKTAMVVEGDSWEHLPDLGLKSLPTVGGSNYDLARALADRFEIHNLAYWGDTIEEIARLKHYVPALRSTGAPYLLLGGGGNDLLGGGRLKTYLRLFLPDRPIAEYVTDQFYLDLKKVMLSYKTVLADIAAVPEISGTKVVVHGYDYAQPMNLGWLGEPMAFMGIDDHKPEIRNGIVRHLIDAFNYELKSLAAQRSNVIYVDFRGRVGNRWHDELHPRREAFVDLANYLVSRL